MMGGEPNMPHLWKCESVPGLSQPAFSASREKGQLAF